MSRKYFGTDGIRGRANGVITPDLAMRVGMAAGIAFQRGDHRHRVVIGKDTRLSGYMMESALVGAPGPRGGPTGALRITRHPMMWGFALWAICHLIVVGTVKAVVLDGAILILALGGSIGQDKKKAALMGERWHEWTAQTAFVPFTRGISSPGLFALVGGTLLLLVATWLHPLPVGPWRWIG